MYPGIDGFDRSLQVGDLPLGFLTNFSCSRRKNNPPWCLFAVGSCMRCESGIYHVEAFVSCIVVFILIREALHHIVHLLHHDSHIGSRLGCSCVCGNHGDRLPTLFLKTSLRLCQLFNLKLMQYKNSRWV